MSTAREKLAAREAALMALVGAVRSVYVEFDRLADMKRDLRDLMDRDHGASEAACHLLAGPSGSGKTKFILDFMADFPRLPHALVNKLGEKADHAPIICTKVPRTGTRTLAEQVYEAFALRTAPRNRREQDLIKDIQGFAREMRTQLVILEEAHQPFKKKGDYAAREVAGFCKDILNEATFAMLIVGTEEALRLKGLDEEFDRRCIHTHRLASLRWDVPDECEDFLDVLRACDAHLAEAVGVLSRLDEPEVAIRLHVASRGLLGYLAVLLEKAGMIAVRDIVHGPRGAPSRSRNPASHCLGSRAPMSRSRPTRGSPTPSRCRTPWTS
ncbi:ATP-binding protein [Dankookia sp. P2]|uniref:ATP-binding protein n=1 Tax=Dankookia sp. P2 TaxID=3423955 RepID=UPI003D67523A